MLLAIDPSSKRSGWAAFDYSGQLLDFGSRPHKGSTIEKLSQLEALVYRVTYDRAICRLAIESQFVGKFASAALAVSRYCGAAIAGFGRSLRERNVIDLGIIDEIAPASVKLTMAGSGRATKEEMVAAVERHFNVSVNNDDEADAIAIGYAVIKRGEANGQ